MFLFFSNGIGLFGSIAISIALSLVLFTPALLDPGYIIPPHFFFCALAVFSFQTPLNALPSTF